MNEPKPKNRFKFSKLGEIKEKSSYLLSATTLHGIPNIIRTNNTPIRILWCICFLISVGSCSYFIKMSILNYLSFDVVTKIRTINENESEFPTISICPSEGHNLSFHVFACSFNSNSCNKNLFEKFYDESYAVCHKINSAKHSNILKSVTGGVYFGLHLNIIVYNSSLKDKNELVVYMHNKSESPYNIYNKGFTISSGSINTFKIERVFETKLSKPYNNCLKDVTSFDLNKTIIEEFIKANNSYSQLECIRYCRNLKILEESDCNCIRSINSSYYCTHTGSQNTNCYHNFTRNFQKKNVFGICSKYCPLECDTINYSVEINTQQLPVSGPITHLADFYNNFTSYEDIQKRYFKLRIFYPELRYMLIEQEEKTLIADLVSNVGGTFGLFLGISFLSIIEYVELFIEAFIIILKK